MTNFQIYPAVDLKDGNCVRLVHAKENKMTIYEDCLLYTSDAADEL